MKTTTKSQYKVLPLEMLLFTGEVKTVIKYLQTDQVLLVLHLKYMSQKYVTNILRFDCTYNGSQYLDLPSLMSKIDCHVGGHNKKPLLHLCLICVKSTVLSIRVLLVYFQW